MIPFRGISTLVRPAFDAGVALTCLDERIARSPVGAGFLERQNFADACASLWIDGELVHLEDLVLHDALRDTRTPTHELTIARDVLHTSIPDELCVAGFDDIEQAGWSSYELTSFSQPVVRIAEEAIKWLLRDETEREMPAGLKLTADFIWRGTVRGA